MTERQHEAWQHWLMAEWNRPSRSDHYLMQLTAAVNDLTAAMTDGKQREVKPLEFKWKQRQTQVAKKPKLTQVTMTDGTVHNIPQRLDKAGVARAEQMWRLFELSNQ